ncbi:acyl carrier protein [Pseudobutyrivibrio xylanivorans]|uniref:Acyl carrier protein n=1 Tax=Pseudobutyrivibrio xylanivorans TaxID=185007 RepID=A0A5P6VQE6_PSEXY|nr:phosphopantetheine-binding protein [Pseudobutyrivibrio xylanivorans]QFJ54886.1 acyl carrier protein [Pseudobutyrivibrio xylanivorans]
MSLERKFKELISQYCQATPEALTDNIRFREDLDFSSLDFMSFLGELEDEFDVELQQEQVVQIRTVGEALSMLQDLQEVS